MQQQPDVVIMVIDSVVLHTGTNTARWVTGSVVFL
jgi:hypothetical protein